MKTPLDLTFEELAAAGIAASERADASARAFGLVPEGRVQSAAKIVTLGSHMCRWPIGDPSSTDFSFCGRRSLEGAYCVEHARIAYGVLTDIATPAVKRPGAKVRKEPRRA